MIEPYYKNDLVTLYRGDCLEVMDGLDPVVFDAVITDPPYGNGKTACKWDAVIPFELMWPMIWSHVKGNGAVCLFSNEPFTSKLVCSNLEDFRYRWNWKKESGGAFQLAKVQPMSVVEDICVFSKGRCANGASNPMVYYPIMTKRENGDVRAGGKPVCSDILNKCNMVALHKTYTHKYPTTVLEFTKPYGAARLHPTQKPVPLLEYLVRTYTVEGESVLDFTAGSGSLGEACMNLNRNCVLIEKDEKYCEITAKRLEDVLSRKSMELDFG